MSVANRFQIVMNLLMLFLLFDLYQQRFQTESAQAVGPPHPMVVPVLGRPFVLGAMYDVAKDEVVLGLALWDLDKMDNKSFKLTMPNVKAKLIASERFAKKSFAFGLNADIKASFLGGLFEVHGSADFLTDRKVSNYEASVSFMLHKRTHFHVMTMDAMLHPTYGYLLDQEKLGVTHVVTAIEYGGNAVFRLSNRTSNYLDKIDFTGQLSLHMNLGFVDITGQVNITSNTSTHQVNKQLTCDFVGDVSLPYPPLTFGDAIRAYQNISELINQTTAVPLVAYLTPINLLKTKVGALIRKLSGYLLEQVSDRMEEYHGVMRVVQDLKNEKTYKMLRAFRAHITSFEAAVKVHQGNFQHQLLELLPTVRGGGRAEEALAGLLDESRQMIGIVELLIFVDQKHIEAGALAPVSNDRAGDVLQKAGQFEQILFNDTIKYIVSFTVFLFAKDNFTECILFDCASPKRLPGRKDYCKSLNCWQNREYKSWITREIGVNMSDHFSLFTAVLDQNKNITDRPVGERTTAVIRGLVRQRRTAKAFATQLYQDGDLVEEDLQLPKVSNLTRDDKNKSGHLISWNVEEPNNTKWMLDYGVVKYRNLNATKAPWAEFKVHNATSAFIPLPCAVEVVAGVLCKFGVCAAQTKYFDVIDNNNIKCNKQKQGAAKAKKKYEESRKNKTKEDNDKLYSKSRIIVLGGKTENVSYRQNILIYDPAQRRTVTTPVHLPSGVQSHVTGVLGGELILEAGGDVQKTVADEAVAGVASQKAEIIDVFNKSHTKISDMKKTRVDAASVVFDGVFYVCGGQGAIRDCESFNDLGHWIVFSSMTTGRKGHALLGVGEYLYAIAGEGPNNNIYKSVERYSLKNRGYWQEFRAPLRRGRSYFGAAVLNYTMYVCGGYDQHRPTPTGRKECEMYNETLQNWMPIPPMSSVRIAFSMVSMFDGQMYAVGGYLLDKKGKQKYIKDIFVYNYYLKQWDTEGQLCARRAYSPVVVAEDPFYEKKKK